MDFFARTPEGGERLVQVCTDLADPAVRDRELRALAEAAAEHPRAEALVVTLESLPANLKLPARTRWQHAAGWLLGE